MKFRKSNLMCFLTLFIAIPAFAEGSAGTRGGADGLSYRVKAAKKLALGALDTVSSEELNKSSATAAVKSFYSANRENLKTELKTSPINIGSQDSVQALVNGKMRERKANTGLAPKSEIFVSRELNTNTSIQELITILIHEAGHHVTGRLDENAHIDAKRIFLDDLGNEILEQATTHSTFIALLNRESFGKTANRSNYGWQMVTAQNGELVCVALRPDGRPVYGDHGQNVVVDSSKCESSGNYGWQTVTGSDGELVCLAIRPVSVSGDSGIPVYKVGSEMGQSVVVDSSKCDSPENYGWQTTIGQTKDLVCVALRPQTRGMGSRTPVYNHGQNVIVDSSKCDQ